MGMLLIDDNSKPNISDVLKAVCSEDCHRILDKDQVRMLPKQIVLLLTTMFELSKKEILRDAGSLSECEEIKRAEVLVPMIDDLKGNETLLDVGGFVVLGKDALQEDSDRGMGGGRSMFFVSKPEVIIPELADARKDQKLVDAVNKVDSERVKEWLQQHADFYKQLEEDMLSTSLRNSMQDYWDKTVKELSAPIEEYVTVLEEVVLPFNKYTRKRCALKGSSLHLPGLVKAVISNFTYKKFFAQKSAGGKRNYSVCFALDISASMNGHLGHCAQETLICMIAALQEIRVDFSIVLFGQRVRIIKTNDQVWSPAVLWTLMNYRTSKDTMTMDADGIDVALQLVQRGDAERKVFVLTDGYGTCGQRLPLVLDAAERQGTDVVALGVGADRKHVKHVYSRYVSALLPAVVPQGLRALYLEESIPDEDEHMIVRSSAAESTVTGVLANPSALFDELQADMSREREATLVRGDRPDTMTVDVAFCLDCTGSMSAWIAAAKGQILTITEDIAPKIQEKFPDLKLEIKFSLIGFRDYGDSDRLVCFPADYRFSDNKEAFKTHLQSLVARGGVDGPEDLLGALNMAGTQLQWESQIKYLVIITDAPAHGQECNDDPNDRYRSGDPNGLTMKQVMEPIGQKKIDLMFCQVKKTNTQRTEELMEKYYNSDKAGEQRAMQKIQLFDADAIETGRFHFVFCLDESGSMAGDPWQALMRAFSTFINKRRNDQGMGDVVSTITFSTGYRTHHTVMPIDQVSTQIDAGTGGTNFDAALCGAGEALRRTSPGFCPMLIFMSDGQGGGNPVPTIQGFRQQYPGFVCHCVGLGAHCDMGTLRRMSDAGGGMSHATEVNTIAGVFSQIAAGCAAMDGMVTKFGEKIAGMVATRICLDHM
jgi:Mg-chelatase subunit ChlD